MTSYLKRKVSLINKNTLLLSLYSFPHLYHMYQNSPSLAVVSSSDSLCSSVMVFHSSDLQIVQICFCTSRAEFISVVQSCVPFGVYLHAYLCCMVRIQKAHTHQTNSRSTPFHPMDLKVSTVSLFRHHCQTTMILRKHSNHI